MLLTIVSVCAAGIACVLWYSASVPSSQVFGPTLVRGPSDSKQVTLTFDDGPSVPWTPQILEILGQYDVPATFFLCGENVERHAEVVRRIRDDGHLIGNHSYSHPVLYWTSRLKLGREMDRTQELIEQVTGERPTLFRSPNGIRWFGLFPLLRQRGLIAVQWSDTGFDWCCGAEEIVARTLQRIRPGAIILLHDGDRTRPTPDRSETVKALPNIIERIRRAGFRFVPLTEFLPPPL